MSTSKFKRYVLALVLVIISFGCTRNMREGVAKEGEFSLSPRVATGQLENGLSYYFLQNREPAGRCYLRLNVSVGSFVEDDEELGMAHFLEHLAFDDRSISGDESLTDWFQKHGMSIGPDANAETHPEYTTYKIDLPTCDEATLQTALRIFRSFTDALEFRDEAIAKEKNIIDAEEREYNDSQTQLTKKLLGNLYGNTFYVSRPVLGESHARSLFTKEMFKSFYTKWYTPDNISVVIVGDYGDVNLNKLISETFQSVEKKLTPRKPTSPNPDYNNPFFVVEDRDLAHVETVFSIQAKKLAKSNLKRKNLKEKIAFDLAISMLRENYGEAFHQGVFHIRQPSIDGTFIDEGVYELNLGVPSLNDDLESKFLEAFRILVNAAHAGFDENAFNSAKTIFRDTLEQAVVAETTLSSVAWTDRIVNHVNADVLAVDAAQYLMFVEPVLAEITANDAQTALKKALKSGHHYLYALGAITTSKNDAQRLAKLLKDAKALKPQPALAKSAIEFLYRTEECTPPPLEREAIAAVLASKLRLKNGIEIILKPTKIKSDEIQVEIITSVGESNMSKEDLTRASLAKLVLLEGGLGKHDPSAVTQIIRDKYFNLSLSILSDRVQASFTTRNRDLQFVLELAKAYIVDPAYNDAVISRLKNQIALAYQEFSHQMWWPLQSDFLKLLTNNDYRVGIVPNEDIAAINRDALLDWHKRFIKEQNLRIVVVGDFDEETVSKAFFCAFNDLPERKKQAIKSATLSYKSGVHQVYEVTSKDQAALINVRYPLNFTSKPYPDHRLQILQALVGEVVRLKLKKKRQTTYSPHVTVTENKLPTLQNTLDVTFFVDKDKAKTAAEDIKQILTKKLGKKGIKKEQLTKAKEPYLAQAKRAVMANGYWASVIANNFDEAKTLTWVSRIEADVAAITIQEMNQLLQKYFHVQDASSAIVYPIEQK